MGRRDGKMVKKQHKNVSFYELKELQFWNNSRQLVTTCYLPLATLYSYRHHNDYLFENDNKYFLIEMRN